MNELIKRAFEVRDAIRECIAHESYDDCAGCAYRTCGCINTLMLDAAKVIERMIEETNNGDK